MLPVSVHNDLPMPSDAGNDAFTPCGGSKKASSAGTPSSSLACKSKPAYSRILAQENVSRSSFASIHLPLQQSFKSKPVRTAKVGSTKAKVLHSGGTNTTNDPRTAKDEWTSSRWRS